MTPESVPDRAQPASGPARSSGLDRRIANTRIGLAVAANAVRSPGFQRLMIMAGIAVVALARVGKENQAATLARLRAWDQRQKQKLRGELERAKQAVSGD